ncbi:hypothetical protein [Legionella fallonii]|uniref:Uncharacterized protein n=1 Tax=Legionella fallonii LLAP-10 TaxID=1212491 RepID=A0A098G528_9GAMM|nr:hypothetical protein [Legionella fallonii]CEG57588.1 protein of unknown function [Legionella fallonii LLAP-10]
MAEYQFTENEQMVLQLICDSNISQWKWLDGLKVFQFEIPVNYDYSYANEIHKGLKFLKTVANEPSLIDRVLMYPSIMNVERIGVCVSKTDLDNIIKPLLAEGIVTAKEVTLISPHYNQIQRDNVTKAESKLYQDNYHRYGLLSFTQKHEHQLPTSDLDIKFS